MKRILTGLVSFVLLVVFSLFGGSLHFDAAAGASPSPQPETPSSMSAEPEIEPTPTPEPEQLVFSFIGDITPDAVTAYKGTATAYQSVVGDNYSYVFDKTRSYFTDDEFTMANFECVMSDSTTEAADKNFNFRAPTAYSGILTDGSVEFVTLANNHILDYGEAGRADTEAALDAAGIGWVGRDSYVVYTTRSGLRVGVYGGSFVKAADIEAGISALKSENCDFIIAALHWGDEGSYQINADQTEQGHAAIDAGADIVVGSHPHTLQPIERYNGGYIFYSMGNWSFGGNTNPRDKDTFIAQLTITRDAGGECSITGERIIPCASSGVVDGNNYQPVPYEEGSEEYQRVISKLDGSFSGADLTIGYTYGFGEYASTQG